MQKKCRENRAPFQNTNVFQFEANPMTPFLDYIELLSVERSGPPSLGFLALDSDPSS